MTFIKLYGTHKAVRDVQFYEHGSLTYSSKSEKSVAELSCVPRKERPIGDKWECENGYLATFAILRDFWEGVKFSGRNYLDWLKTLNCVSAGYLAL